jgi:hypothetical protein
VRSFNVASPDCAAEFFAGRQPRCVELRCAGSLGELRTVLERRLGEVRDVRSPVTLDLIGHSTREHQLLRLGQTPIDMLQPGVARFFGELAGTGLLPRLNVVAVRLLGCETAVTDAGQRTLRMLARTLRLKVYGTRKPLLKSHSIAGGFDPVFAHLLVEASTVPARPAWRSDAEGGV